MSVLACLVIAATVLGQAPSTDDKPPDPDPTRFASQIDEFTKQDETQRPAPGGIVFVGSSSIRRWDLDTSFPGMPALNRGFGGSQYSDALHYFDRVVVPYAPKLIVLYEGDNDLFAGKSPERIADDFRTFAKRTREALPEAVLIVLSIKPSPARAALREKMDSANLEIARQCADDKRLIYLDVATPLLGPDDMPRAELFRADGLHLNEKGYQLWAERLMPILKAHGFQPSEDQASLEAIGNPAR